MYCVEIIVCIKLYHRLHLCEVKVEVQFLINNSLSSFIYLYLNGQVRKCVKDMEGLNKRRFAYI